MRYSDVLEKTEISKDIITEELQFTIKGEQLTEYCHEIKASRKLSDHEINYYAALFMEYLIKQDYCAIKHDDEYYTFKKGDKEILDERKELERLKTENESLKLKLGLTK